jgi:hypothetical protein
LSATVAENPAGDALNLTAAQGPTPASPWIRVTTGPEIGYAPPLGTQAEPSHIVRMKLNSPESIIEAAKVFRSYGGSWTAARAAGQRDKDGVLVIPVNSAGQDKGGAFVGVGRRVGGKAG